MKILVVQPPLGTGTTRMPLNQRLFPWGLATMARCLEDDGHEIKVLDIYASDMFGRRWSSSWTRRASTPQP